MLACLPVVQTFSVPHALRKPRFSTKMLSAQDPPQELSSELSTLTGYEEGLPATSGIEDLHGPIKWERVGALFSGQSLLGLGALAASFAVHGNIESLGLAMPTVQTLAVGAAAALPLCSLIVAEDMLKLEEKMPALQKVSNVTKFTVLMAFGGERVPATAAFAALALALAAGVGEEALFRGLLQHEAEAKIGGKGLGSIRFEQHE